jgi:hypothetical protein
MSVMNGGCHESILQSRVGFYIGCPPERLEGRCIVNPPLGRVNPTPAGKLELSMHKAPEKRKLLGGFVVLALSMFSHRFRSGTSNPRSGRQSLVAGRLED